MRAPALVVAVLTVTVVAGVPAAAASAAAASAWWRPPTSGGVTRGFAVGHDPFAAGNHRGADFAAAPDAPVRAVCAGRVVVATRIGSSGGVVTLACGPWRVSHLPLATIAPHVGAWVDAGDPIGTADASRIHAGVHVGVRRAGTRYGYVDPLRFIRRTPPGTIPVIGPPPTRPRATKTAFAPPHGPVAPRGRAAPRSIVARRDVATRRGLVAPGSIVARRDVAARRGLLAPREPRPARPFAPWPAWAGLAGLLLAATTRGARWRRRENAVRTRPAARAPAAVAAGSRDDLRP